MVEEFVDKTIEDNDKDSVISPTLDDPQTERPCLKPQMEGGSPEEFFEGGEIEIDPPSAQGEEDSDISGEGSDESSAEEDNGPVFKEPTLSMPA